jgi:hypothetical protein
MWTWMHRARGRLVPQTFTLVLDFHVAGRCGKWDTGCTFFSFFFCAGIWRRRGELREGGGGMRSGMPPRRGGVAFCAYRMLDAGCWISESRSERRAMMCLSLFGAPLSLFPFFLFSFSAARYASLPLGSRLRRVSLLCKVVGGGGGWMDGEGGWEPLGRGREIRRLVERRHPRALCVCCNPAVASRPWCGRSFPLASSSTSNCFLSG